LEDEGIPNLVMILFPLECYVSMTGTLHRRGTDRKIIFIVFPIENILQKQ